MSDSGRVDVKRATPPISCSVVVLNYNYARFLRTAITSALHQTHHPVEVIVVDDASTDDSQDVVRDFGDSVTPVIHESNRGQGAAINSGAAVATGDLLWFLDADDALLPDACASAVAAFEREPRLAKFHTPLAIIDGGGRWAGHTLPADRERLAEGEIAPHVFTFRAHGWPPMSGNAYSADALRNVLPVPADIYRQAADSFLNEQVAICGPLARSAHPVAAYRVHGSNQFAGQPLDLGWLRTKIDRELCSHEYLGLVAEKLGHDGYQDDPTQVRDVSFLGYRMASLRLDPEGHPAVGRSGPDSRFWLAVAGIKAALANPQLASSDRAIRSLWFLLAAATPARFVSVLLSWYLPDGPSQPFWRRRRRTREDAPGALLIAPASAPQTDLGGLDNV